jgi:hypothetical protein
MLRLSSARLLSLISRAMVQSRDDEKRAIFATLDNELLKEYNGKARLRTGYQL